MKRKTKVIYAMLPVLLGASLLCALGMGSVKLDIGALLRGEETESVILLSLRLPRVLGAALAGAALAPAGLILQAATGNDLAAPNVVGVNTGAGLGVMMILCLWPGKWALLPLAAFCGALAAAGIVLFLSAGKSRSTVLLAGVAVSAMGNAVISFLSLRFPDALVSYTGFTAGGFSGVRWRELPIPASVIFLALIAGWLLLPRLERLSLGDEAAYGLGIRVKLVRALSLVTASALCASAVSYAGLLGFVGLMVPHILRKLGFGGGRRALFPNFLAGATLTVLADLGGRVLFAPTELPAGILTAAIGAPFFLWLLIRGRDRT